MRYFKIVGEKAGPEEPTQIFETGQLKAEGPVEALDAFSNIIKFSGVRKQVESVFAKGGYLVMRENKS
ncbi:MAG: hypothetical protein WBP42_02490 [Candidatus Zixiibacteriota bacterium]